MNPLKVIITNYPEEQIEYFDMPNNNENESLGTRRVAFGREVYIEQEDFFDGVPEKGWKRWAPGLEVRLMHAYFVRCNEVIYHSDGSIKEIHATYDPLTKSGSGFNARKPNGNIHFVEASTGIKATYHLFQPLMVDSDSDRPLEERLNPDSWKTLEGFVEKTLSHVQPGEKFQFVRNGYFSVDYDTTEGNLIFNRTVELKSSHK
ncbi:MAG: hypothetical protein EOM23_07525 [Candidatus Moranbacteria bacterium]|nr:hypothetical protein [Candidatus Moranbacteria bacterium]